jgi:hypothetical protein
MDTFAGINTGVEMPVIDRHDEAWHYSLSQMLLPREAEFVEENEGGMTSPETLIWAGMKCGNAMKAEEHAGRRK